MDARQRENAHWLTNPAHPLIRLGLPVLSYIIGSISFYGTFATLLANGFVWSWGAAWSFVFCVLSLFLTLLPVLELLSAFNRPLINGTNLRQWFCEKWFLYTITLMFAVGGPFVFFWNAGVPADLGLS